jgi:hypothetical protein
MVENRDAINRWRDGLGEIAGLAALALRENWRNLIRSWLPGSCHPRKGQLPSLRVMAVAETLAGDGHHR